MGTNLHNIRFPTSARSQRIKALLDLRKSKRLQVFRSHRLRHFLASDDRIRRQFQAICHHLDLINYYSNEQKITVLLLIVIGQMPQIADFIPIDSATKLMQHLNDELRILVSSICYIVKEIDANYLIEPKHSIGTRFENDNLAFRLNVNSISDLMAELLSLLLENFSNRCQTNKILISKQILCIFELCFQRFGHNQTIVERNLHTILALTHGIGRFQRITEIVEHEPLVQRLMNCNKSLIVLKIINSITNGFPENIEHLLRANLLNHLKHKLTNVNPPYDVVEQCLHILENICGNHRSDILAVIDGGLIETLINVFKLTNDDISLRKIACNTFLSISSLGSIEQIKILLELDLLQLLCCQLHENANFDEDTFETILETLNDILRDSYRKNHPAYHHVCAMISECGGFIAIGRLTNHNIDTISNAAMQLNQHSSNICARCNQSSLIINTERMQL